MAARWPGSPSVVALVTLIALARPADAGPIRTGFDAATLARADDASSDAVALGFGVDFFGQSFSAVYVNSNGNLSFGAPVAAFTPVPLGLLGRAVVAPFFADVDTDDGGAVGYGTGTVDGRPAFAATWAGVGYYSDTPTAARNDFQAVLVDRADTGRGNFDVEFNYGRVGWESGDFNGGVGGVGGSSARVGFASGAGPYYELPGSGVPGTFTDGSTAGLSKTLFNSDAAGRHVFQSRDGVFATPDYVAPAPGEEEPTVPPAETPPGGPIGTPEPATALLAVLGGLVVAARRRVRRSISTE